MSDQNCNSKLDFSNQPQRKSTCGLADISTDVPNSGINKSVDPVEGESALLNKSVEC